MKIFIDIDNTILKTIGNNYAESTPIYENILSVVKENDSKRKD